MEDARGRGPLEQVTIERDMSGNRDAFEALHEAVEAGDQFYVAEMVRRSWPKDIPLPGPATINVEFHQPKEYHIRLTVSGFTTAPREQVTLH